MKQEYKEAFDNILDTMSGADGGVRFVHFKIMVEELDKKAAKGDRAAEQILYFMVKFSQLIDIANIGK